MARILVGPIPEPDDMFGREQEIAECWTTLAHGNLLLLAPRRFGKSGVMRHLQRRPQSGLTPIWLHLEHIKDGVQFAEALLTVIRNDSNLLGIIRSATGAGRKFLSRVEEIGTDSLGKVKLRAAEAKEWQEVVSEVVSALEARDTPILFLWDELPAMVKTIANKEGDDAAREFLSWFRSLRLNGDDELSRHRFVVAGSTGLDYLLNQRLTNPETINDFRRVIIGPLSPEHARKMCQQLAAISKLQIDELAIQLILKRIGQSVPYFIQLFFSQLQQSIRQGANTVTPELINTIFDKQMAGPTCKAYFDQYRRRLKQYPKATEMGAIEILATIAAAEAPIPSEQLFQVYTACLGNAAHRAEFADLLADLECDWYLQCDPQTDGYYFYMAVMRDWWRRWYRPAARDKYTSKKES